DVVVLSAMCNYSHKTSIEVGVRVETEDMRSRARRLTTKAYLTFVAVDGHGRPLPVPPLELVSDEDRRRWGDAEKRRMDRLRAAGLPRYGGDGGEASVRVETLVAK